MFKTNDVVKGKVGSGENEFILEADVLYYDEEDNTLEIMIIKHEMDEDLVGDEWTVDADDFVLAGVISTPTKSLLHVPQVAMTSKDVETALILGII